MQIINISFFYLILGFLSSQKVDVFGEIYVGEIFCGLVLLLQCKSIRLPSFGKNLLLMLVIWFIAQLTSDIVNQTELEKALKGILVPVIIAVVLLGLNTMFYGRYKYLSVYLFGVFIGVWFNRILTGNEYYAANPWKWGMGASVALCFFTWIEFYCRRWTNIYLWSGSLLFVGISMMNSSRSLAAIFLLASMLSIFSSRLAGMPIYKKLSRSSFGLAQLLIFFFIAVLIVDRSMVTLFTFEPFLELFPTEDAVKYRLQAQNDWGYILGGRTEFLVSFKAFFDAPLLGHGSWPENPYYVYYGLDAVDAAGGLLVDIDTARNNLDKFLIPTHSHLMGAIVWGGIAAGLFWLRVLGLLFSGFLRSWVLSSPLSIYISLTLIWGILFSPFGADARWMSTVLLVTYLAICREKNQVECQAYENFYRNNFI